MRVSRTLAGGWPGDANGEGFGGLLAASAPPAPAIQAFNHVTHAQLDPDGVALTTYPLDIHGVNFKYGTVSLYLDDFNGTPLGDVPVQEDGRSRPRCTSRAG